MNVMSDEDRRKFDVLVRAGIDAGWTDQAIADSIRGTTYYSVLRYRRSIGVFRSHGGARRGKSRKGEAQS